MITIILIVIIIARVAFAPSNILYNDSLTLLRDEVAALTESGERWLEAEIHRLKGDLLLAQSANHQAETGACYRQALDVAGHRL